MGRARATANKLKISGLSTWNKEHYSSYNMTEGNLSNTDLIPQPRTGLSKESKAAWDLMVTDLVDGKELSRGDLPQLNNLIEVYEEIVKVKKLIKDYEKEHKPTEQSYVRHRRALSGWLAQNIQLFTTLSSKFGLTPVDRTRLPIIPEEEKSDDPLEIICGDD